MAADGESSEILNPRITKSEEEEKSTDRNDAAENNKCVSEGTRKTIIGLVIVVLLAVSWVGAQQFAQVAVRLHSFDAPFFTTWYSTCWMILCFPGYCVFVAVSERNKPAFVENMKTSTHLFGPDAITASEFFKIVWTLNAIWLTVNYLYIFGLKFIYAADASAIMASNVAFVYILSLCVLREKLYVIRIAATVLCISGVVLFGYSEGLYGDRDTFGVTDTLKGVLMIIASAFGAAVYKVVFKKVIGDGTLGQVSLFLTLLGISNICVMWIVSISLYVAGVEHFSAGDIPWELLNLSALLGLIFNFLVNFGIAYTYPLFISIAMMIGIPLNAIVDAIFHHGTISSVRFVAAVLVFAGFVIMLFPDSWNDPIHSLIRCKKERPHGEIWSSSGGSAEKNLLTGSSRSEDLHLRVVTKLSAQENV